MFHLRKVTVRIHNSFLYSGDGGEGTLSLQQGVGQAVAISELLMHYASDTVFQSQEKLAFQVKVPGREMSCFPS